MTKRKGSVGLGVPQRHLHSRLSYLYQAAHLLSIPKSTTPVEPPPELVEQSSIPSASTQAKPSAETSSHSPSEKANSAKPSLEPPSSPDSLPLGRLLLSHMWHVSLKSQIRLTPDIKRSICKRCKTLLIPPNTSSVRVENLSRRGKKVWADVVVVGCDVCGAEKRFPTGTKRQAKRAEREAPASLPASLVDGAAQKR